MGAQWSAMTWNVLFGGEDRFARILALIARAQPDVLVLQECLGWEEGPRLNDVARAMGVPEAHARLGLARPRGSGRRFHVALCSRFPLARMDTHADPARIGHCIVDADVLAPGGAVRILGAHFDAHGEDERLRDARTLCALAPTATLGAARALVAGDLNALSRQDPYPADLDAKLVQAGVDKYGHPPRFEVMEVLERGGWTDLLHARLPAGAAATWVTAVRDRGGVRIDYRTDYVLASAPLAAACTAVEVLACEGASDHEPVIARFT
jgi:exodeoxyribonuclease-3